MVNGKIVYRLAQNDYSYGSLVLELIETVKPVIFCGLSVFCFLISPVMEIHPLRCNNARLPLCVVEQPLT